IGAGPATADVAAHLFPNVGVGTGMPLAEQADARADLAGGAVAALEGVVLAFLLQPFLVQPPCQAVGTEVSALSGNSSSFREATMGDTSVTKVQSKHSPRGAMGQRYLASGVHVGMRLWENEQPGEPKPSATRDYETVGYVLEGRAELHLE